MKSSTSRRRSQWLRLVAQVCVPLTLAHATLRVQAQDGNSESAGQGAADASDALTPPPRAALQHYEKGRALYLAGRYREAAVELESAIALDPDSPNLVYNLAHVYELLGEIDLAIRHYKHYRELLTDQAEIDRVDSTLQRLRGARHHVVETPAPTPPPPPAPHPEAPRRGVADAAFWTVTTFALAGLATGGVLGGFALKAEKEAQDFVIRQPEDGTKRQDLIDRADRLALGSDISLLAGAVLGTTAILLFALRTKPAKSVTAPQARWNVDLGPKGAFLSYRRQL